MGGWKEEVMPPSYPPEEKGGLEFLGLQGRFPSHAPSRCNTFYDLTSSFLPRAADCISRKKWQDEGRDTGVEEAFSISFSKTNIISRREKRGGEIAVMHGRGPSGASVFVQTV